MIKPLSSMCTMVLIALLSACMTQHHSPTQLASNIINRQQIITTTTENYPSKRSQTVSLYNSTQTPHSAYRVIGIASVSKFNLFGIKRQEKTLNDMMKKLAASIGGDGLININSNEEKMEANVIAFQKILI